MRRRGGLKLFLRLSITFCIAASPWALEAQPLKKPAPNPQTIKGAPKKQEPDAQAGKIRPQTKNVLGPKVVNTGSLRFVGGGPAPFKPLQLTTNTLVFKGAGGPLTIGTSTLRFVGAIPTVFVPLQIATAPLVFKGTAPTASPLAPITTGTLRFVGDLATPFSPITLNTGGLVFRGDDGSVTTAPLVFIGSIAAPFSPVEVTTGNIVFVGNP
jgi:hypothetical protein